MLRALVVVALLAGCGGSATTPTGHDIGGTFTLHDEDGWGGSDTCRGGGGYADIQRGLQATLTDQDGTVIGTTSFPTGQTVDRTHCQFSYEFHDVPDADFYTVTVGRRGELTYSFAEMEGLDWTIASTLGD